jgi:ribosome maturation factor RimP
MPKRPLHRSASADAADPTGAGAPPAAREQSDAAPAEPAREKKAATRPDRGHAGLARLREAIAPLLAAHGVELVEAEWTGDRMGPTLRLTIERPGEDPAPDRPGGVSLDDCAEVSRDVSTLLDVEDLVAGRYNLEVSSPGLDRKLRGEADFVRFVGRLARVKLTRAAPDGQRLLRGTLEPAPAGRVAVRVDGKRVEVPSADVEEARLVFELEPPTEDKRGAAKKAAGKPRSGSPRAKAPRGGGAPEGRG